MDRRRKTDKEIAETSRARRKRMNDKALENWDRVSCNLPKGTKERITNSGNTLNGLINKLVLEYLDEYEKEHQQ